MIDLKYTDIKNFVNMTKEKRFDLASFYAELVSFIKNRDAELMAFESFDSELILESARNIVKQLDKSREQRLFYGVPVAVKDVFNTIKLPTQKGSSYWKDYIAGNDARVVENLKMQGVVITGKTVTAELAVHHPGRTKNPHNFEYSPGTSSMGSAAAVCAGMSLASLGTQTGSSIIRPASYTGIFGYKPSYGTIPRTGVLKTTDTLDHVGFFANNIDDIILLFDLLRVRGENYPISNTALDRLSFVNNKKRIGALRPKYLWNGYQNYVKEAFDDLMNTLGKRDDIALIDIEDKGFFNKSHEIHSLLYDKSLSYYFGKEGNNKDVISSTLYEMVRHGKSVSVEEFHAVLKEQELIQRAFEKEYGSYDLMLTPSTANIAPKADDYREVDDSGLIWSLLGVPSLNIPAFRGPDNMPFGLQAVGVKYSDYRLLKIIKDLVDKGLICINSKILNGEKINAE